jgi:hypothetical protein
MRWQTFVLVSLALAVTGCGRGRTTGPDDDPSGEIRRMMKAGRKLNSWSPETVGSVVPRLHAGMSRAEVEQILMEKESVDPKTGRPVGTVQYGRGAFFLKDEKGEDVRDANGEPQDDPSKWYLVFLLKDGDLTVVFDNQERVLSWSAEPLRED